MSRRSIAATLASAALLSLSRTSAFYSPASNVAIGLSGGVVKNSANSRRCQDVSRLSASPMDKFMSGLADMMSPQKPKGGNGAEGLSEGAQQTLGQQPDMDDFRRGLINQAKKDIFKQQQDFTGYDMYDLIVDKFDVPYDVQINKTVFAGKPVLCFNVMWKYLGQSSFHLSEQAYLEHLEALAQLLKEWDRVDHFKMVLEQTKKRPNPYFGYAVALPLDLAPDTLAGYFEDSYFD